MDRLAIIKGEAGTAHVMTMPEALETFNDMHLLTHAQIIDNEELQRNAKGNTLPITTKPTYKGKSEAIRNTY